MISEGYKKIAAEKKDYRAWVGPASRYDMKSSAQFSLLTSFLGMREHHKLLDVGCGSLRLGRLCIVYLQKGNYYGVEPEEWAVKEGGKSELGEQLLEMKNPTFSHNKDYNFKTFGKQFDYIIAQSVFSHAPRWQVEKCVENASKALSNIGRFVFNYGGGAKDYARDEWMYPACVTYTPKTIHEIVEKFSLHWVEIEVPLRSTQKWVVVSKRKELLNVCLPYTKDSSI